MKPYQSSSDKENCSPISSNCIIWQGPSISCINLCKGDSVSDIVYKLAVELCDIQTNTTLTEPNGVSLLQLDCLLQLCSTTPKPELTTAAVLQLIINKICCTYEELNTAINNLAASTGGSTNGNTARTGNGSSEPILDLPLCLQYTDTFTGQFVTTLPLTPYVINLANAFCTLKVTVEEHTTQISSLDGRVTILEDAPCCYVAPTIVPSCAYGGLIEGISTQMNTVVTALDGEYCTLRSVLGTNTQLISAAGSQCANLGSLNALSQSGTMSSLPGWNNTINSFAQSMQNLWLTVCDMRGVINDLRICCAGNRCSSLFLGFTVGSASTSSITLFFNTLTTIPGVDYLDCPTLSSLRIDDGNGHVYDSNSTANFSLITASTDSGGVTFDITAANLNDTLSWTITVNGCIINDAGTCSKTVSIVYPPITPTTTTTTAAPTCSSFTFTVNADDLSDATGNANTFYNNKVLFAYHNCGSSSISTNDYALANTYPICINPNFIPFVYYLKDNAVIPATRSQATFVASGCIY